jgi:erythromycin esterase-like protein
MQRSLLALLLASVAVAQTSLTSYLEKNRQPVDLANFDAKLLDFHDKQILFLGESHGIAINEDLDLALLKYLHREAGVRVYLGEFGYAAGFALNQYLQTGDEKILDYVVNEFKGSVAWTKERREFYVKVHQWNASLPPADQIRFVGIDV